MKSKEQDFALCMDRLKKQISTLSHQAKPSHIGDASSFLNDFNSSLHISNQNIKYQLKHGSDFKDLLDPRDRVLQHQFSFDQNFSIQDIDHGDFTDSRLYRNILQKMKEFLVEAVSNVISISFKFLCKGELEQKQAKDYASKNIMLNVHSVFRQTVFAIEKNQILKNMVNPQHLRDDFIIEVDNILTNILNNLAASYPQAPVSGGTPRMRQAITLVDRSDDDHNDFIHTSGVRISDYVAMKREKDKKGVEFEHADLGENGDYTQFIMKVINAAVQVAQDTTADPCGRTVFELFNTFNQHLFYISQQKEYQKILEGLDKNALVQFQNKKLEKRFKIEQICSKFKALFQDKEKQQEDGPSSPIKVESTDSKRQRNSSPEKMKSDLKKNLNKIWGSAREGIQTMKKSKKFAIGQKIPASVKTFSKYDIKNRNFTAKHSSVLRILTKWAECLEETFQNPEKLIKERLYPFTNLQNQPCSLRVGNSKSEDKLKQQLQTQYKILKKKFRALLRNGYNFIGSLLCEDKQSFVSNVCRYTQTRKVSSKINAVLTSLMLNYTSMLIHHLLRAGQNIKTDRGYQDLNLITFKVYDLIRSKFQCSQTTFISLLKNMYFLDSKESMKNKFKIMKIRDKLDEPANNIIINYLFMGKVQCELQLSIQQSKGKQKNYYTFSHFVYQLTRGIFGSIAECAIMISQLDPMISTSKGGYYQQKKTMINLLRKKDELKSIKEIQSKDQDQLKNQIQKDQFQINKAFFKCSICQRLITNQDMSHLVAHPENNICYHCLINKKNVEQYLQEPFKSVLSKISSNRLWHYWTLKNLKNYKFLIVVGTLGQAILYVVTESIKQSKTHIVKVDSHILETIDRPDVGFESLDLEHMDITGDILKSLKKKNLSPIINYLFPSVNKLLYLFDQASAIPDEVLKLLNIDKKLLEQKVPYLISSFNQYQCEKKLIKSIQYKAEIIKANQEEGLILDKVCKILVLGEGNKDLNKLFQAFGMGNNQNKKKLSLKYIEVKSLSLLNLQRITSERVGFENVPKWIKECYHLKYLDLDQNSIKEVKKEQLPPNITFLSLKRNKLESIDISNLHNLNHLLLMNNCLKSLNISQEIPLQQLNIRFNSDIKQIDVLPKVLQKLWADKNAVANFDFKKLDHLKYLRVSNGQIQRRELKNLLFETILKVK